MSNKGNKAYEKASENSENSTIQIAANGQSKVGKY
jgi:hypothetical protein